MKKLFAALFLSATALCTAQDHSLREVYDLYKPDGVTKVCHISVSGDLPQGRVSMYPTPRIPEIPADENGIKTVYTRLVNIGSEDGRAFHMWASTPIKTDEWTRVAVSFVPRMNGKVRFFIRPEYATRVPGFLYPTLRFMSLAKLGAKGTKFQDMLFDKKLTRTWNVVPFKNKSWEAKLKPEQFKKAPDAPGGKYVKTCRDFSQVISVKKEQEVVIYFYVKAGDEFLSKIPGDPTKQ